MELNFPGLTICKRQIQVHINETILAKSGFAYIHSLTVCIIYVPPTLYFQIVSHFGLTSIVIIKVKYNNF